MPTSNKKLTFSIIIIGFAFAGGLGYFLFNTLFVSKTEFDAVTKENPKIIAMFNKQIEAAINDHTQSNMNPGYITTARQNVTNYLSTISTIESYSRHGVKSTQSRNYIEVDVTFNNGTLLKKLYTGLSCSGYSSPCVLFKVAMQNGKATQVFTNGAEKNGSPDWIINDLNNIIKAAVNYDIKQNRNNYFLPDKTNADFEKEWKEK